MKKLLLATTALLAVSTTSFAADLPARVAAPAPMMAAAPAFNWTGFYVGGTLGLGEADFNGIFDSAETDRFDQGHFNRLDVEGAAIGLHLGYNWHVPGSALVAGIEADWQFTNWSDRRTDGELEGSLAETDFVQGKVDSLGSLRGRLGLTFGTSSMVYATGGLAWVRANVRVCDCDNGEADIGRRNFDNTGWVAGAGFETFLTNNVSFRLEGLYYNFDTRKNLLDLTPDSDDGDFAKLEDAFVARLGLSYRF